VLTASIIRAMRIDLLPTPKVPDHEVDPTCMTVEHFAAVLAGFTESCWLTSPSRQKFYKVEISTVMNNCCRQTTDYNWPERRRGEPLRSAAHSILHVSK
jgi:hypothetical protein